MEHPYKQCRRLGSGCGPVGGGEVASDTRDPRFESSQEKLLFTIKCIEFVLKRQKRDQ